MAQSSSRAHLEIPRIVPRFVFSSRLGRRSPGQAWRRRDSNPRPSACKADALPVELRPPVGSLPAEHHALPAKLHPRGARSGQGRMGVRRVELRTSRLSGGRSDHLSYTPRPSELAPWQRAESLRTCVPSDRRSYRGSTSRTWSARAPAQGERRQMDGSRSPDLWIYPTQLTPRGARASF